MADDLLTQLPNWLRNPNSFPDRFLSQSCPLLEIARLAQESGRQRELVTLLNGDEWQRFLSFCDTTWRKGADAPHHQPSVLLRARRHLVLAAMGSSTEQNLEAAVQLTQSAIGHSSVPQLESLCDDAARFDSTDVVRRLRSAGHTAVFQFRNLANTFGGWNPALLSTAAAYAQVFAPAPKAVHTVQTHLLFALGEAHGGQVARLTLDRIEFDSDAGGGACYPDAASMGYVKSHSDFQHALQQAWWREICPHVADCSFDIRWSLQLVGDDGGHNINGDVDLRDLRTQLLLPLSGPSAGMAFACAFRAMRLKERLDPHIAITADFAVHFDERNDEAKAVGGVPDKLRTELERAGIDEVLTSNGDPYFTEHHVHPDADGICIVKPKRGRLKLIGLANFAAFYKRASQHSRLTDRVKQYFAERAKALLATTCTPHVRSSLSDRRPGDPARQEPPEVPVPLSDDQVESILLGKLEKSKRLRLLAESGLGKSTLLIEAEYLIATADNSIIPLRLGAGPAACSRDDLGRWTRLPLLSDFDWQAKPSDLLAELAERLLGEILTDRAERTEWFERAVARGEVVYLLDSLDQTDGVLKLDKFANADGARLCPVLLSARPETRRTKSQSYAGIDWQTLWVDPFDEARIRRFWGDAPLLEKLLGETDWAPLREVPVLLQQMKRLALNGLLENLPNREAVYHRTLEMLVQHGQGGMDDAGHHVTAQDDLLTVERVLSEIAWETIQLESQQTNGQHASFTGELSGKAYATFARTHRPQLSALDQLNLTTRQTYLDEFGVRQEQFGWRHFSFCEWFAGIHLASLPTREQDDCIRQHALNESWAWIFRFALSAAAREENNTVVNHLAMSLLSSGAAFLLWTCIGKDQVTVEEELDTLCRWLVHRDRDSWTNSWDPQTSPWSGRGDQTPPVVSKALSLILKRMFGVGEPKPWQRRDSRWLHPAWQLVVENLPKDWRRNNCRLPDVEHVSNVLGTMESCPTYFCLSPKAAEPNEDPSPIMQTCQEIHDSFLGEFEVRISEAVNRNQRKIRSEWHADDRGLLQLVPDDVLLDLGVLPSHTKHGKTSKLLRHWPGPEARTYEQRRDQFNAQLRELGANYCLCPPVDWEHPYPDADGAQRHPRECRVRGTNMRRQSDGIWVKEQQEKSPKPHFLPEDYQLQRTPVTNVQFEVFDPGHRRWRQMQWYRPEMERSNQALDDHPVVEVSWYQAVMMCIWLTGHGRFGTFRLPFEEDWEACCRAGRDKDKDEFGIPWCDEQQRPILDPAGRERFDSLSSLGANFDGNHPDGQAQKGPYLKGTVPVGQYAANGFGAVDQHGQVWEWGQNESGSDERNTSEECSASAARCVRGGSWGLDAWFCRASDRFGLDADLRSSFTGFRLSRTP